jgi:ectoine hydroxylase-related dioxygenase (phytanoyl-CoA dioxygenase family)
LPSEPLPVRAIYFDKSPETNWLVPWHQDLSLALRARAEVPGFGPWSTKDGIPHVQPPAELLQQMLTVRLHLDDADESNGALRVLPGSHRFGRLSAQRIQQRRTEQSDLFCTVAAGDALLMRPLLLHASSRSTSARHRRVLHIEYAGFTLPDELNWHEAAQLQSNVAEPMRCGELPQSLSLVRKATEHATRLHDQDGHLPCSATA